VRSRATMRLSDRGSERTVATNSPPATGAVDGVAGPDRQ
jgi:hypothetical protein